MRKSNLQHSLCFTKECVAVSHFILILCSTRLLPLLHLKCQRETPTQYWDKNLVQLKTIKMSRYPFNHSLFFLDSSLFVSDLHTYCTHVLHLFFHIYICHVYFSFCQRLLFYQSSEINYDTEINWCCLFLVMQPYCCCFCFLLIKLQILFISASHQILTSVSNGLKLLAVDSFVRTVLRKYFKEPS